MSATRIQTRIQRRFLPSAERLLAEQGKDWLVSAEQTMQLRADDLRVGLRPDAYVLPCRPADDTFDGWPAFAPDTPAPIFALEVVSHTNWNKDYVEAPQRYALLGTEELVLFDPMVIYGNSPSPTPVLLQLYRRSMRGTMVRVYAGRGPVFSRVLEAWLHVDGDELMLCRDKAGKDVVLTPEQAESWWKQRAEAAEQRAERAEKTAEQEAEGRGREEQARQQAEALMQSEAEVRRKAEDAALAAAERARIEVEARQQAEAVIQSETKARHLAEEAARAAAERTEAEAQARLRAEQQAQAEQEVRAAAEQRALADRQARAIAEQQAQAAQQAAEQQVHLRQQAEGQALAVAREAVSDVCELLGVELSPERRQHLALLELAALQALRIHLKLHRTWPA